MRRTNLWLETIAKSASSEFQYHLYFCQSDGRNAPRSGVGDMTGIISAERLLHLQLKFPPVMHMLSTATVKRFC
jgi:hypothetical protein